MTDTDDDRAADYEYDEAHEFPEPNNTTRAEQLPRLRPPEGMNAGGDAGDYSYDAAHDRV